MTLTLQVPRSIGGTRYAAMLPSPTKSSTKQQNALGPHRIVSSSSLPSAFNTFQPPLGQSKQESLFNALVGLKVAVSTYAMHLLPADRDRLFSEFDYLLESESWDEEDVLPRPESLVAFLKWIIYSGDNSWTSIGIGNEGNILAAWHDERLQLTANFDIDSVKWTVRANVNRALQSAAGRSSLSYFRDQAKFYLKDRM
jgi:hypothetical protein